MDLGWGKLVEINFHIMYFITVKDDEDYSDFRQVGASLEAELILSAPNTGVTKQKLVDRIVVKIIHRDSERLARSVGSTTVAKISSFQL